MSEGKRAFPRTTDVVLPITNGIVLLAVFTGAICLPATALGVAMLVVLTLLRLFVAVAITAVASVADVKSFAPKEAQTSTPYRSKISGEIIQ